MGSITRPHHMGLQVRDLARSLAFYRDLLGFTVVFAWNPRAPYVEELVGAPGVDLHAAILRPPDSEVFLELLEYRGAQGPAVDTATRNPGTAHIAFFVDDLDSLYSDLTARGVVSVSTPVTPTIGPNKGGRAVYMIDPDGIRVELIQSARSFAEFAASPEARESAQVPGSGGASRGESTSRPASAA